MISLRPMPDDQADGVDQPVSRRFDEMGFYPHQNRNESTEEWGQKNRCLDSIVPILLSKKGSALTLEGPTKISFEPTSPPERHHPLDDDAPGRRLPHSSAFVPSGAEGEAARREAGVGEGCRSLTYALTNRPPRLAQLMTLP